jgi:hypothetical protein
MRTPDFTSLTNKRFENKFNHERESKSLVMHFLDIQVDALCASLALNFRLIKLVISQII